MTTFELEPLRQAVESKHGSMSASMVVEALTAYHWKKRLAAFHCIKSKEAIATAKSEARGDSAIESSFWINSILVDQSSIEPAKLECEAHLVGAAHAMHSLADILAHAVYGACGIENTVSRLPSRQISFARVLRLPSIVFINSLSDLKSSPEFIYLDAYVNTIKHVTFLPTTVGYDFETQVGGIRLSKFERNAVKYESKWSSEFLDELNVLSGYLRDVVRAIFDGSVPSS